MWFGWRLDKTRSVNFTPTSSKEVRQAHGLPRLKGLFP